MKRLAPDPLWPALLCALACENPSLAPGLDEFACGGGLCAAPGVIAGNVRYAGTARGDAILLLFDTEALPPPDGNGSGAAALARVPEAALFKNAAPAATGPFSAPFTFTQVPSGRSYQIRAFVDASHQFNPSFDYTRQPRAGDPAGGYGERGPGNQQRWLPLAVAAGQAVTGIEVALGSPLPFDPPSFELVGGSQTLDQDMDRPISLKVRATRLDARDASFDHAHFAMELDRDAEGNRRSSPGDGLDDVFPRVFLRQLTGLDEEGNPVAPASAAIVPCRAISTPLLPALVELPGGATPLAVDVLEVFVQPWALRARDRTRLAKIPAGDYQVVVLQRSGQLWTVPNQLGDPGTPGFVVSQGQTVTIAAAASPAHSIGGTVAWRGDPSVRTGNVVVQAYRDDPFDPPPPIGIAAPVRVQIIPASAVARDGGGFSAPYRIAGLPAGRYLVTALDDVDGNFSQLHLLRTPTRGDLMGAVLAPATGRPASITVDGAVEGEDVTLSTRLASDPPAFDVDPATPAFMPADQVTPIRLDLRARALSFPAGRAAAPRFAVQLMRDASGAPVDEDGDGLPDVWPRVFLVRLDSAEPAGLTQYVPPGPPGTRRHVIPAAVDPTPFLPALQPQTGGSAPPVLTEQLSVIVRPVLFEASAGAAPQRLGSLEPGPYRIVLSSETGQVWQIPNEAGAAALDPRVVCPAAATFCAPGTVQTHSQSGAFQVGPRSHATFSGGIAGTLTLPGPALGVHVFARPAGARPPFAPPLAAHFHAAGGLQGGSVSYVLANLAEGDYVVTAVVDTRGDFAVAPPLFALAPGAGTLVARPVSVRVSSSVAQVDLTAGTTLPPRPSFILVDGGGGPVTQDLALHLGNAPAASMRLKAAAVLGPGIAALHPDSPGALLLSCDAAGMPMVGSVSIQLIKVAGAAGLVPELDGRGRATVVSAALDASQFPSGLCTHGVYAATGPLDVLVSNAFAKVDPLDPSQPAVPIPLAAGRYAVILTSLAGQVWRLPNELQPALLDGGALLATPSSLTGLLRTQQVAVNLLP